MCIAFFIFLCISILFSNSLQAQTWTMPVDGKVFGGGNKLGGAIITLFKGGQQIQQVVTTSNGRFSFELPPNAEYIISITKPGYITKKFKISTANVPPDRAESGGFNPFEPDVILFEMPTAPEISKRVEAILSQPIAIYQYIPSETNFNYDEKYTQAIQDKLAELAQLQKQVEKEIQEKAKSGALEAQKQFEIDKKYKEAIGKADASFNSKDYSSAKNGYNEALTIKPGEAYPKTRLSEINKLMAEAGKQNEIDAKYNAAVKKGDAAFSSKDYTSAKTAFTEAAGIKSNETYPKTKLSEIDKLLAEANQQKESDAKYQAAIAKGDGAFNSKDYVNAKAAYTTALEVKPREGYPKTRLSEIDKLLADAGKQKEIDVKYQALIAKGDAAFNSKDYTTAKTAYNDATGIKPAETYPKTRITEIDKLLAATAKAGELEKQYKDLISKADNLFGKKDYSAAKSSYSDASSLKPAEQYPRTKIAEIDKLLADLASQKSAGERDQQYKDAIAKADKLFTSKDYAGSKTAYNEALGVKPNEGYPKTRISEIDKILANASAASAQKDIDAKYKAAITLADGAFAKQDYLSAKSSYADASGIKPAEIYPKTKLEEIDKLLANAANASVKKEEDARYNATIAKADKSFKAKDYSTAKPQYAEALRIKPQEQYPTDKLAEIERIEKSMLDAQAQQENNLQYDQAIASADKLFSQKDYFSAKSKYEEALDYKPGEKYPKDKLLQINNILNKPQAVVQKDKKDPKQNEPIVSEEAKIKEYQSELRSKYPAGVTEEEYTDNGKIILRRVVIKVEYACVYTKVTHNWGGVYCFKDNIPITEVVFENESR